MIYRETCWHNDRGDRLQVAVTLLDDSWEPLREITVEIGPFDDASGAMATAWERLREWVATYGIQPELPLDTVAPRRPLGSPPR